MDLIGKRLNNFEITALIGEGGMAAVFRARQMNIARDVAIKVIKTGLVGEERRREFLLRFQREAETIAILEHPHILKLFEYGQQDDVVYLVMPLLIGGNLAEMIHREPLSLERTVHLLDQMSAALDYAHRRGVVHRDLKPHNVLLDADGNAVLSDFGFARMVNDMRHFTQSGLVIGTPFYMSPEQWRAAAVDGRADIYALGVMVFEMLSGQLPFEADTPAQLMFQHINESPQPLCDVRSEVPESVEAVINKALAKRPDDRWPTASAFAAAFRLAMQGTLPPEAEPFRVLREAGWTVKMPAPTPLPDLRSAPTEATPPALPRPSESQGWRAMLIVYGIVIVGIGLLLAFAIGERNRVLQPATENVPSPTALVADSATIIAPTPSPGVTASPRPGSPAPTQIPMPIRNADWTPQIGDFDGVEMVLVPPGCFQMGGASYSDEGPVNTVCFSGPFWLDRFEVTNEQFQRFGGVAARPSAFDGASRPRETITWPEARDFCSLRGGRLPSEAEWEYAARGPDSLIYPWGNQFDPGKVAYDTSSTGQTADVGAIPGNVSWVGALDLAGNVWEWTASAYRPYPFQTNTFLDANERLPHILRGGSWVYSEGYARAADRFWISPGLSDDGWGFRCARDIR